MFDIKRIRDDFEAVQKGIASKGYEINLEHILELDQKRRSWLFEVEELKAKRNHVSKDIAARKKNKENADDQIIEMREVSQKIKELDNEIKTVSDDLHYALLNVPNIPHDSVPFGRNEADNVPIRTWGEPKKFEFQPLPHWELTSLLDILDLQRGTKITGSGFPLYKGAGARLERALLNFFLDLHTSEHGFTEIFPPILVNEDSAVATGQLPDKEDQMYVVERDGMYLIPTAEVPLTNIHRDEILQETDLPIYYAGYTPNFRREAGSYGKDVRGLNRVHQFNKVELVKFVHPDDSYEELERLTASAEKVLQLLELPYRVLLMCSGDMGFTQAKKYDIEVWAPGQQKWLEVSSCSNFEDYQARRANIRFRSSQGKPQFVHTLNGSGLATPRTLIAILEHYQTKDGKIQVPKILQPYMRCEVIE